MKQQWDDLRALFDAAWPLSAAERAQLLDERCGADARLRRELEKLLHAHDEGEAEAARRANGTRRFGVWETTELAGRGGMAEVYVARRIDGRHEQRAALKVMARAACSRRITWIASAASARFSPASNIPTSRACSMAA